MSWQSEREPVIIQLAVSSSRGRGLMLHDLYVPREDRTIKWDSQTGEVSTILRGIR